MLSDSPYIQHFGTNYTPSAREIGELRTLLLKPIEHLQELDKRIAQLQAEQELVQTVVDNHRALLSPFRRLPADIWSLVFVQCLPPSEFAVSAIAEAPLLLTRICHSWREIALSTPGLWNSLHFNVPLKPHKAKDGWYSVKIQGRMDGIMAWLDRSGSLPLRLSMSFGVKEKNWRAAVKVDSVQFYEGVAADFATILLPYSSRWQSLALNNVPRSVLETLTLGGDLDVPMLQKIQGQGLSFDEHANILYSLLNNPGGDISLRIDNDLPHFIRTRPPTNAYWSRLTELCITKPLTGAPPHVITQVAEVFPYLRTCDLRFMDSPYPNDGLFSRQPIEWKHLQKLSVGLSSYINTPMGPRPNTRLLGLSGFFDVITTPALTHFSIAFPDSIPPIKVRDEEIQEHPFHRFFIRSECNNNLTHLRICIPMHAELLLQSLSLLSSLKFLNIGPNAPQMEMLHMAFGHRDVDMNSSVLETLLNERLFNAFTSATLCPSLEELNFLQCSASEANVNALLHLAHVRKLKALIVNFGEQPASKAQLLGSDYVTQSLEKLKLTGLEVGWHWSAEKIHPLDSPYDGLFS